MLRLRQEWRAVRPPGKPSRPVRGGGIPVFFLVCDLTFERTILNTCGRKGRLPQVQAWCYNKDLGLPGLPQRSTEWPVNTPETHFILFPCCELFKIPLAPLLTHVDSVLSEAFGRKW